MKILSHRKTFELLKDAPKTFDILMISSPEDFFGVPNSEQIPDLAREYLLLSFDDIEWPSNMSSGHIS